MELLVRKRNAAVLDVSASVVALFRLFCLNKFKCCCKQNRKKRNKIEMNIDSSDSEDQPTQSGSGNNAKNLIAGKIVKIHLENFLTHSEATVYPNEQLNLVSTS